MEKFFRNWQRWIYSPLAFIQFHIMKAMQISFPKHPIPLTNVIWAALRWSVSIGAKLVRTVPGYTYAVIFSTLASQISMLLAFFLPMKVIILLGSSRIPRYFPSSWQSIDRDNLIIYLAIASAGFYLLYLLAERSIVFFSERGANRLLEKSKKIALFQNQREITVRAYQRYTRSLAGAVFVGLALIAINILYPALLLFILGYVFCSFILLLLGNTYSSRIKKSIDKNLNGIGSVISAIGFLLAFAFMVFDFLAASAPGVIEAVIGLLLVRQLMQRLTSLVLDQSILYDQRLQVNALFFHGHPLMTELHQHELAFWSILETHQRDEWLRDILREVVGCDPGQLDSTWHQTGIADVVAFKVTIKDHSGQPLGQYLIKLFNTNRKDLAQNEASLLSELEMEALPTLRFIGADTVGNYQCNIFQWTGGQKVSPQQNRLKRLDILERLIAFEPKKHLVEQYTRSRSMLAQWLSDTMIDHLRLVAGISQLREDVEAFKENLENLRTRLGALPLQIFNPDISPDTLFITEKDKLIITHWGRWRIEPIGAGWPVQEKELALLEKVLFSARKHRPSLIDVAVSDMRLAALTFAFKQFYSRQQYVSALELLPSVLKNIEHVDAN